MHDLRISGTCDAESLLNQRPPAELSWRLLIDLSAMKFIDPIGLVSIAALAELAQHEDRRVSFVPPANRDASQYLARMNMAAVLDDLSVPSGLPTIREQPRENTLLEVTRFSGIEGVSRLAQMIHRLLERTNEEAANALYVGVLEAGANVIQHSGREGGYMAAQLSHSKSVLQFAVSDSGVGMLHTLVDQGATSHARALDMSLKRGVSENPAVGRGVGLYDINDEITGLGGELHMLSGNALLRSQRGKVRMRLSYTVSAGTIIQGVIPIGPPSAVERFRQARLANR